MRVLRGLQQTDAGRRAEYQRGGEVMDEEDEFAKLVGGLPTDGPVRIIILTMIGAAAIIAVALACFGA